MTDLKTIFGDPIRHPDAPVRAFVGAFASDFLGDYDAPQDAFNAAQRGGYRTVHVMYDNDEADAIDVPTLPTKTVYVVDADGMTDVYLDQADAERGFVEGGWQRQAHLTITKAVAPAALEGEALITWCIANVSPMTCDTQ